MSNLNYLSASNFRGNVHRLPETVFHLQRSNLPGISGNEIIVPTMLNPVKETYDKMTYNELMWSFLVDEEMKNYSEIFQWMHGVGFPQNFKQYADLNLQSQLKSDISIVILNSSKRPIKEVIFHDAFPTTLSDLQFDTTSPIFQYLEAHVTFTYDYFTLNDIS